MGKYSEIRTADQLQAALKGVRSEIKSQEKLVSLKCDGIVDRYRPSNIVSGFLNRNSDYFNWADVTLRTIRILRSRFKRVKRPAARPSADQTLSQEERG